MLGNENSINPEIACHLTQVTPIMFASEEVIADIDSSIHQLVDTAEILTSELRLYETLIRKRTDQINQLRDNSFKEILDKFSATQQNEYGAKQLYQKLNSIIDMLDKFDAFSYNNETITEDLLQEYMDYLQSKNDNLLIIKPAFTNFLLNAQQDEMNSFLDSKNADKYVQIIFILRANLQYSLVLLSKAYTSAYHFDLKGTKNHEWAERLLFKVREYFMVDQITHFECCIENVPSSVFLLENMMKIVYSREKNQINDDFATQLLKLPPQIDRLILIVARKYIQIKFSQINNLTIYLVMYE